MNEQKQYRQPAAMFIGRYSPFHNGHKFLVDQALAEGTPVLIAVRERPLSDSDPFTLEERMEMIRAVYEDNPRIEVISIPDIESVNVGRDVGYRLVQRDVPREFADISATWIRSNIFTDASGWEDMVPEPVVKMLKTRKHRGLKIE